VALVAAHAWRDLAARRAGRRRTLATAGLCALIALEFAAVPLGRFQPAAPDYHRLLAADGTVDAVVELPAGHGTFRLNAAGRVVATLDDTPPAHLMAAARHNRHQLFHGKKIVTAYPTFLPVEAPQVALLERLVFGYLALVRDRSTELVDALRELDVDVVVQNRTQVGTRQPLPGFAQAWTWRPFVLGGSELVRLRQLGPLEETPIPPEVLARARAVLDAAFGAPVHEDEHLIAWRVRR
jgi:hypothetical protein